jgi:hypothetical protein
MLTRLFSRDRKASPALVGVHQRDGQLFIQSHNRTIQRTAGFWVGTTPITRLTDDSAPGQIGEAVIDALNRSKIEVPIPTDHKAVEQELFKVMGVRSRRASMAGTRYCSVEREARAITIAPYHNGGASGDDRGYRPLGNPISLPLDAPAESIGEAVRAVLARSTP